VCGRDAIQPPVKRRQALGSIVFPRVCCGDVANVSTFRLHRFCSCVGFPTTTSLLMYARILYPQYFRLRLLSLACACFLSPALAFSAQSHQTVEHHRACPLCNYRIYPRETPLHAFSARFVLMLGWCRRATKAERRGIIRSHDQSLRRFYLIKS